MLNVTNIPAGEKMSDDFYVLLTGKQVQLYELRVSATPLYRTFTGTERPTETTETASLLSFEADAIVTVRWFQRNSLKKSR